MLNKYQTAIKNKKYLNPSKQLSDELLIEKSENISVYYAPFEHINTKAKVVICGITPGLQQAQTALDEASKALVNGADTETAAKIAKNTASFGGAMRTNLIEMLDFIGLAKKLQINSCAALFNSEQDLVHYTSVLRYPVFINQKNYSGSPSMLRTPLLKGQIDAYFVKEVEKLDESVVYIPLGPKVSEVLEYLCEQGTINESQVLSGLPHPSGANAERISYFLEKKPQNELSVKTNASIIDSAKHTIMNKVDRVSI